MEDTAKKPVQKYKLLHQISLYKWENLLSVFSNKLINNSRGCGHTNWEAPHCV